jgi:prophage regulatory protein
MLNEKQVLQVVPVSRTTLWSMVRRKQFPPPVWPSPNKKMWFEDAVVEWQSELDESGHRRGRRKRSNRAREREATSAKRTASAADANT